MSERNGDGSEADEEKKRRGRWAMLDAWYGVDQCGVAIAMLWVYCVHSVRREGGERVSAGKKGERNAGERNECDGGWAACD